MVSSISTFVSKFNQSLSSRKRHFFVGYSLEVYNILAALRRSGYIADYFTTTSNEGGRLVINVFPNYSNVVIGFSSVSAPGRRLFFSASEIHRSSFRGDVFICRIKKQYFLSSELLFVNLGAEPILKFKFKIT